MPSVSPWYVMVAWYTPLASGKPAGMAGPISTGVCASIADIDLEVGQRLAAGRVPVMLSVKVPVAVLSVLGLVPVVASTVVTGGVRLGR